MSSVALNELCPVWKDNRDDIIVKSITQNPNWEHAIWKTGQIIRQGGSKKETFCIMGSVGSSVIGAWPILLILFKICPQTLYITKLLQYLFN